MHIRDRHSTGTYTTIQYNTNCQIQDKFITVDNIPQYNNITTITKINYLQKLFKMPIFDGWG